MTEADLLWADVLSALQSKLSDTTFSLWFSTIKLGEYKNKTVTLIAENEFKRNFLEEKYLDLITRQWMIATAEKVVVRLVSVESLASEESKIFNDSPVLHNDPVLFPEQDYTNTVTISKKYTFENFVVGSSNRVAHRAAFTVATEPGKKINPLFLYGPSGIGKTHLLFAIVNEILQNNPGTKMLYVTGEQFTNELIDALAQKHNVAFRDKYRKADILLVDDIQFIAGKYTIQEEFFHTFDALYKMEKQIVLTSDRSPRDINYLESRLISRFEMGLIADIQAPDDELRTAIFAQKAMSMGVTISPEVLAFLSENITSNIRQIEGAIKKLWAQSFITNENITVDMASRLLTEYFKTNSRKVVTPENIFDFIKKRYSISKDDLLSKKRNADIVYVRHIAIYLTSELTDFSLKKIGRTFNRDHATIISAKNNVINRIKDDAVFKLEMEEILDELSQK